MRAVVQRVSRASVTVSGEVVGQIGKGLLVLLGVSNEDSASDSVYLAEKISTLRIFDDEDGKMNQSIVDVAGDILVVSQFTLYGDVRRGRRPSWSDAAPPDKAAALYEDFVSQLKKYVRRVETGTFRAMMQVELVNDGPVTLLIDSSKLF
ncbi:MAG: D-aminoacyl-tRNA deacylase [Blastocatellia bacterium]|jgi:D-tyrosyl-tRNA(Tyr) deacylase|nr:D-aminoacyl-tRNA deacylase [Blastocatellia bacterium]